MEWPTTRVLMGGHWLNFESSPDLGPELEAKAFRELRETEEVKKESMQKLKQLINDDERLQLSLDDDIILYSFLRACKYYPDSAYTRILNYHKMKNQCPKWYNDLVPSKEENVFKNNLVTVFPYRDQHGRRVLLIEAGKKWDVQKVSLTELLRAVFLLVMAAMIEPKTQVAGTVVIIDVDGLSLNHVWQFSPSVAKNLVHYLQECFPCRLLGVHIVNQPYIFNMVFSIFKPFLNHKLRSRIHFHGNHWNQLCEHIDPKILPSQYGGEIKFETNNGEKILGMLTKYEHFYKMATENKYIPKDKKSSK